MSTYIYMPPLKTITGGMNVIMQIAAQLHEASWPVFLVSNGEIPQSLTMRFSVPILRLEALQIHKEDRWVVPEGWPAFLAPGLKAQASCAVYVQNWGFLHGLLPGNTRWCDLPIRMFSVSQPVSIFIRKTTGFNAPIIRPAIDPTIFHPGEKSFPSSMGEIRIAWMPRKNKHLAKQIRSIFEARIQLAGCSLPKWFALENLAPDEVAAAMREAHIFLATGFPEGLGLPPLEAMTCGCIVAGFTGMGGWDYMRQAMPDGWLPPFALRHVAWGPNGFFAADGDVWGASDALLQACERVLSQDAEEIRGAGYQTAASYDRENQKKEILKLWEDTEFWVATQDCKGIGRRCVMPK